MEIMESMESMEQMATMGNTGTDQNIRLPWAIISKFAK
jgi:hypothetical protein